MSSSYLAPLSLSELQSRVFQRGTKMGIFLSHESHEVVITKLKHSPLLSPPSTPPKIPQITRNICNIFLERTALPQLDKQTAAATPAYPRLVAYEGQSGASNIFSANPGSTMVSFVLSFSFSLFLSVRAV